MRTVIRVVLVLGSIGALALGTTVPVLAQFIIPCLEIMTSHEITMHHEITTDARITI